MDARPVTHMNTTHNTHTHTHLRDDQWPLKAVLSELDVVRASEHNSARAAWVAPNQSIASHEGS